MNTKKIAKTALLPFFFLINLLAAGSTAFAGSPAPTFSVGEILKADGQKGEYEISAYIVRLINFLALLIGSCAFLAIIIGGLMLVTSAGKEAQVTKGKDIIKYAIIGLVVAMASYYITAFVQSVFYEYGT